MLFFFKYSWIVLENRQPNVELFGKTKEKLNEN